jgi:drug/metabolite transporter (DMT)-like permease
MERKQAGVWVLFIVLSLLWGCSYFFMKKGMEMYSPLEMAAMRIASAAAIMMPWSLYHITKVPLRKIGTLTIIGFFGNGIPAILFCIALTKLDTNLGGILNALTPIWVLFLGMVFFRKKNSLNRTIGVFCGFVGICILFLSKGKINTENLEFSLLIVVATMLYGLNINLVETYMPNVPSLHIATVSTMAVGIVYMIILAIGIDAEWGKASFSIIQWNEYHIWFAIALGVLNTAFSNILFYELVKLSSASFASMVTYVMPFVTIFIALIIGENIAWQSLICLGFILLGVYLVRKSK